MNLYYHNRLSKLHEKGIDFRALSNFKDRLYNSELTTDKALLPIHEFKAIKEIVLKDKLNFIED
jgi:hypothetical protein